MYSSQFVVSGAGRSRGVSGPVAQPRDRCFLNRDDLLFNELEDAFNENRVLLVSKIANSKFALPSVFEEIIPCSWYHFNTPLGDVQLSGYQSNLSQR